MIHDSELTYKKTKRKSLYNSDKSKNPRLAVLAMQQAERDMRKYYIIEDSYKIYPIHTRLLPEKFKECLPQIQIINI
jgi:hypothetical protein